MRPGQRPLVASSVRAGVLALGAFMALRELQIAPEIVTIAFTLTLAAIALAAALAFGLGSRNVAGQVTQRWYERQAGGNGSRPRGAVGRRRPGPARRGPDGRLAERSPRPVHRSTGTRVSRRARADRDEGAREGEDDEGRRARALRESMGARPPRRLRRWPRGLTSAPAPPAAPRIQSRTSSEGSPAAPAAEGSAEGEPRGVGGPAQGARRRR